MSPHCSICRKRLPAGRKLNRCRPCQRAYYAGWKAKQAGSAPTAEFPGVDIDRIHYRLGAVRAKKP